MHLVKRAKSGSGIVNCWRVAGAALAVLETLKNGEESVNDTQKNDEGRTYVAQRVEGSKVVVDGVGAVEKGVERQWCCQQLEQCWQR